MKFYRFKDITSAHEFLGGKGFALGLMKNAGFPVPDGAILTSLPSTDEEWNEIFIWWNGIGNKKLAVRSSAKGEDSKDTSFAGQNSTYLNINSQSELKNSVLKCFESLKKDSSSKYREHFLKENANKTEMNVVLQMMVEPKYSGVFFSIDPRTNQSGYIIEAIEGYGEDLVSGKKTPFHFEEKNKDHTDLFNLDIVVKSGQKVTKFFGYDIDMEWAIDHQGNFFVLQARPITALSSKGNEKKYISDEYQRLKSNHSEDTIWDGQTFAEWASAPTELTFSIWSKAFSYDQSFSKALRIIGYNGITSPIKNETESLLEKIFGRAFVNISLMTPYYFGDIPFSLTLNPDPKLKFDFKKLTFKNLILLPFTLIKMLQIGLKLSTDRKSWMNQCQNELVKFKSEIKSADYSKISDKDLLVLFKIEVTKFYNQTLTWPLVLVFLIESTNNTLKSLLNGIYPKEEIENKLKIWMGKGIHTISMEMNFDYRRACLDSNLKDEFLKKYGHRGPGELELSHPRFDELKDKAFFDLKSSELKQNFDHLFVENDIDKINSFKKQAILLEWNLLKDMLELRENFKMNLLIEYSHIRYIALEIAKRNNISDLIFWHSFEEIINNDFNLDRAIKRRDQTYLSKKIGLPNLVTLNHIQQLLDNNKIEATENTLTGTALSPGIAFGEIRVVNDPESVDTSEWSENTILVAESTDPGWTGLFLKSKAIIVEKGGVLSHCAIVAREMNLPAISDIKLAHLKFKDGDKVWVDGNNGRITFNI